MRLLIFTLKNLATNAYERTQIHKKKLLQRCFNRGLRHGVPPLTILEARRKAAKTFSSRIDAND